MKVWETLQKGVKKLEFEESKNLIIPGDGDGFAALEMLYGGAGSIFCAATGWGVTALGAASIPIAALMFGGFIVHGCKKAYDLSPHRFWPTIFEKTNLKADKQFPQLIKDVMLETGREFHFKLPIGMSISDFYSKHLAIENAFKRKVDIYLDESTYTVKVFLHNPAVL